MQITDLQLYTTVSHKGWSCQKKTKNPHVTSLLKLFFVLGDQSWMLHFLFTQDSCPDVPLNSRKKRKKKKIRTRRGSGSYWHSAVLDLQSKFEPEQHLCSLSVFLMYLFHIEELKCSVKNVPLPLIWSGKKRQNTNGSLEFHCCLKPGEDEWGHGTGWICKNRPTSVLLALS